MNKYIKSLSLKAKIGIGILSVIVLFILIGIVSVVATKGQPLLYDVKNPKNEKVVSIAGYNIDANAKAKLFLNDKEVSEVSSDTAGKFYFSNVELNEGENSIYVSTTTKDGETKKSLVKKVTLNTPNPTNQLGNEPQPTEQSGKEVVTISAITDGDTVKIKDSSGNESKLRLIGIDTPEVGRPYAQEATNKLSEIILNKQVELEKDVSETDKYGRLLRYIWLNGTLINEEMVKQGYASSYSYPPDVKYQDKIVKAEQIARDSKIGLWKEDANSQSNNTQSPSSPTTSAPSQQTGSNPPPTTQTQPTPPPSNSAPGCYCSTNKYNCTDFATHQEAQSVFDCCKQQTGSDVHKLDADSDGIACETLP